jgi:hypothetical protein
LEKIQLRIKDLTWNISPPEIHQHPSFFTGQHLKITACNKKTTEKKEEKPNNLHQLKHQEDQKLRQPKGLETKTTLASLP